MKSTVLSPCKQIAGALLILICSIGFSGCSSLANGNNELPSLFSVFATLEAHAKAGAVFTVQATPDGEPITLTTTANLDSEKLKVGDRFIIIYSNGDTYDPYIPGAIDLKNVLPVANGSVQAASKQQILAMQGVPYVVSECFRTGSFINVALRVPTTADPAHFNIYLDEATIASPTPQLYMIYDITSTGLSATTAFGSFNIADVWDLATCTGVNLNLGDTPAVIFKKNSQTKPDGE